MLVRSRPSAAGQQTAFGQTCRERHCYEKVTASPWPPNVVQSRKTGNMSRIVHSVVGLFVFFRDPESYGTWPESVRRERDPAGRGGSHRDRDHPRYHRVRAGASAQVSRAVSRGDERGMTESVQIALIWPLLLLVTLGVIQAGIWIHGRQVALRAAVAAVEVASGSAGSSGSGSGSGHQDRPFGRPQRGGRRCRHLRHHGSGGGERHYAVDPRSAARPDHRVRRRPTGTGQHAVRDPALGRGRRRRDQRGSAAVELTLAVPALMIILALLVAGGRLWFARTSVSDAAYSAARSGSLARTAGEAQSDAQSRGRPLARHRGTALCLIARSTSTPAASEYRSAPPRPSGRP